MPSFGCGIIDPLANALFWSRSWEPPETKAISVDDESKA